MSSAFGDERTGNGVMGADSAECRANAQRYMEMAANRYRDDPEIKSTLLKMAQSWTEAAVELAKFEIREV
jgi:hypothetical protein